MKSTVERLSPTRGVRAREGDVRAFEALARRHQAALYRTAVRVTGDPAEAEDALQEALLDAWRHLDRFRGDGAAPRRSGW